MVVGRFYSRRHTARNLSHGDTLLRENTIRRHSGVGAVDGERKFVTVLFADIAHSSRLVAGRDPEDAEEQLLTVLQLMVDAVHRFGGTVNQVLGDGIMALFGAPRAQEDHALRACMAAETIHRSIEAISCGPNPPDAPAIRVRVGMCSGELVIREAKDEFDLKFRAVGEAVYLARRMEASASPGTTVLSEPTAALATGQIRVEPLGAVRLRPESEPVDSFKLTEIISDRHGFERLFKMSSSSFIGRTPDMGALRDCFEEVEAGQGRALVIRGEAGIGKSRLVFEFIESLQGDRNRVVTCNLMPVKLVQSLSVAAQIIESLLPAQTGREEIPLHDRVSEYLASLDIREQHVLAAILDILGEPITDPAWVRLDPPERMQLGVNAVAQAVCAAACRKPVIVVLEDFQWADSETRLLADALAGQISSSRVFLIVTCRSHHEKTWAAWPHKLEREIQPLSRGQMSALLEALLGSASELEELKLLVAKQAQGNPFFVEECIRALDQSGDLAGAPGTYRLTVSISELDIPATVHGVLAARIDSLSAPDRSALLSASVIGQRVDVTLLRDLEGLSREEAVVRLSRLQQSGFLERTRIMPNLEYSFRHALLHDVAYKTLLKKKRRELHCSLMSTIEKRQSNQLFGRMELLAHHAYRAEDWRKTLAYCRRAGLRAQSKSAHREAVEFFNRSLESLGYLSASSRNRQRAVDLRLELVQSLFPLGRYEEVHRQILAAQERARNEGDKRRCANVVSAFVVYHWVTGSMEQAADEGVRALAMARQLGDKKCEIQAATRLGGIELNRGNYQVACRLLETTYSIINRSTSNDRFGLFAIGAVSNRAMLASALGQLGRFDEAIKVGNEGIRIAEESGHAFSQIFAYLYYCQVLLRKGDFQRSQPTLLRSFELCDALKAKLLLPMSAASLGYAYVRSGQISRGLELLQTAAKTAEQHAVMCQLSNELSWLGEAFLLSGDVEQAAIHARDALELAQKHGAKGDEAWVLRLLGQIHAARGTAGARLAEEYFQRAHTIAVSLGMRPLVAHIDFSLGKQYRRREFWDQADAKFRSALSTFEQLSMTYWLATAEAELAEIAENSEILARSI